MNVKVLNILMLTVLLTACGTPERPAYIDARLYAAAEDRNPEAMYEVFYEIAKRGTPKHPVSDADYKVARYWLIQAGQAGNLDAASVLQTCYVEGCFGIPIDSAKAKHYKSLLESARPKGRAGSKN